MTLPIIILIVAVSLMAGGALGFWGRKKWGESHINDLEVGIESVIFDKDKIHEELKDLRKEFRKYMRINPPVTKPDTKTPKKKK